MQFQQLNRAYQTDPRRVLGQALMQQGVSTAPVQSPLQGLGRLSNALVGAYLQRKASDQLAERENKYRDNLTQALSSMNLSAVPSLQALAQVSPEQALPAALGLETNLAVARARKQPTQTQTQTILSTEQAAALGLPTDKGQVYQQNDVTRQIASISGTTGSPPSLTAGAALAELYDLANLSNRTSEQTRRMTFLNEFIKKPTPVTIGDGRGGTQQVLQPGFDALATLGMNGAAQPAPAQAGDAVAETDERTVIGQEPAQLSATEARFVSNLASAQNDLNTVIDIMFNGDLQGGEYNQDIAILSGSAIGRTTSGDAQRLFDALSNLVDLRLRDRTGATANQQEIENYLNAVTPGITTRGDTQRARIARLIEEFNANVTAFGAGRNIPGLTTINIPQTSNQSANAPATASPSMVNIPGTQ
tara:strand:+ start:13393 stop:14649 length:1257 start_codon:yes stop_codon:yes gene_type:complete